MNPHQFVLFWGRVACFCLFRFKEAERAPKLPSLVERCSAEFAASRTTALALRFIWVHYLVRMDVSKTGNWGNCSEILDSWLPVNETKGCNKRCNVKWKKRLKFTELTGRFITRKTKVVLWGRTTALLKICLRGQVFVCVETSRSHLA